MTKKETTTTVLKTGCSDLRVEQGQTSLAFDMGRSGACAKAFWQIITILFKLYRKRGGTYSELAKEMRGQSCHKNKQPTDGVLPNPCCINVAGEYLLGEYDEGGDK